jgi:hypothetical protein
LVRLLQTTVENANTPIFETKQNKTKQNKTHVEMLRSGCGEEGGNAQTMKIFEKNVFFVLFLSCRQIAQCLTNEIDIDDSIPN